MNERSCLRAGILIERRASGLRNGQRLVLEDHLAACASCREQAYLLGAVTAAVHSVPEPILGSRSRERALKRAFEVAELGGAPLEIAKRGRAMHWTVALVAAVSMAAVIALVLARKSFTTPLEPGLASSTARHTDRLERGMLSAAGTPVRTGASVPVNQSLQTEHGASIVLSHAQVQLTKQTQIIWHRELSTVKLQSGSVRVAVNESEKKPFRVQTQSFTVDVMGTEFEVELQGVRVTRGIVKISSPDGSVLVPALRAGQSWQALPPRQPMAVVSEATAPIASHGAGVFEPRAPDGHTAKPAERLARDWLSQARKELARGQVSQARAAVQRALVSELTRSERAEARSLLADCEAVAGNTREALRLYLVVADEFASLPAGENAMFAAARINLKTGANEQARQLLQRYLQRYPAGKFREDATRHLERL